MAAFVPNFLEIQVISTILFVLGATTNAVIVFLCHRAAAAEKNGFVLLIQIASFSNVVNTLAGWTVLNRFNMVGHYGIFLSYGVGGYLGPKFVHLVDCLAIFVDTYIPHLISLMMILRAFILFDYCFKTRTLLLATAVAMLAALPIVPFGSYVSTSIALNDANDSSIIAEATLRTSYGIEYSPIYDVMWSIYDWVPVGCFAICFFLRFLMQQRLRRFASNISEGTRKLHRGFMNLLTLDATVTLVYYIASQVGFFAGSSSSPMTFHYPVFTLPTIIQACALLYFVPYLNYSLVRLFRNNQTSSQTSVVTNS